MKEIKRLIKAAGYSGQGLKAAYINEPAFRTEMLLLIFLVPTAYWLGQTAVEYALLYAALILVMIVELLNSAIEAVVDRFGGEQHELSGRAKDIASAAVLLAIGNFCVIWGIIFFHRMSI